jgi:pimeloyl-ACP methyl ester carboxylesterase
MNPARKRYIFVFPKQSFQVRSNHGLRKLPTKGVPILDVDDKLRNMQIFDKEPTVDSGNNPLIILSGTAQSIQTWAPHVKHFSRNRRLIIPELRGQGGTMLLSEHGDLNQQINDLHQLIQALGLTKVGEITAI